MTVFLLDLLLDGPNGFCAFNLDLTNDKSRKDIEYQ